MRLKARVKSGVHGALKRPVLERAVGVLYAASPRSLRGVVPKLFPQPETYDPDEVRVVARHGLSWRLFPFEYCQWLHYYRLPDPVLTALRALSRGAPLAVDVGANVGLYGLPLATREGAVGRVVCVEAHPRTFERLTEHVRLNGLANVTTERCALGSSEQTAVLYEYVRSDSGMSSIVRRDDTEPTGRVEVRVRTLDGLASDLALSHVDVVKVDVEGLEPDVLLGARSLLERDRPRLCVEWTPAWASARSESMQRAADLLGALGYECHGVERDGSRYRLSRLEPGALSRRDGPQRNLIAVTGKDRGALDRVRAELARI